ncbi:hypothetical protein CK203_114842 [Vitis vinifera]|uniref:Uncharacterized protein n=1 Tax=Vitis vinifera TaxID=29760 RepID=A0A438DXV3_VITVI|nr:hypothetical protein CK203_114842 [Vitis vinifera]
MLYQSNASQDAKKDDLSMKKAHLTLLHMLLLLLLQWQKKQQMMQSPINREIMDGVCEIQTKLRVKFQSSKKEIERLNLKMDELKQLLLEVKSSNEEHGMHDTRFRKSSTKENDNNMGFDFQTGIFEDVTDDEVEKNDIPMDVNIDMEASRNLQLAEKHMTKELKDDYSIDDPVIDIAKLFGTPTMSGKFSVYVIPHHLLWTPHF